MAKYRVCKSINRPRRVFRYILIFQNKGMFPLSCHILYKKGSYRLPYIHAHGHLSVKTDISVLTTLKVKDGASPNTYSSNKWSVELVGRRWCPQSAVRSPQSAAHVRPRSVFLVASVPGSHTDMEWGLSRAGALLRQHCALPAHEQSAWPLIAQASSLGSYGKHPQLWLTGEFLQHFTKIASPPQALTQPPPLQLIYPSLENVQQSLDGLLGGGCLPYAAASHAKQPWLNDFLYQWRADATCRSGAPPHIKSYLRCRDARAAFFLLTSANVSKAAWGCVNKGDGALRVMSYEAGVMFLPRFVIKEDLFPLAEGATNRLIIPYDLPPTKYTSGMTPWVQDHMY